MIDLAAQTLVNELLNFKVSISNVRHDSYSAWRENIHDDLVLSVTIAVWYVEKVGIYRSSGQKYWK